MHWLPLQQSLTNSLIKWLTTVCLVDYIYVTLACEDANSKLVLFIAVTDVDAEKYDDSLVKIWKLKFGHYVKFLFRLWGKGLVRISKLKFKQHFEADFGSGYEV